MNKSYFVLNEHERVFNQKPKQKTCVIRIQSDTYDRLSMFCQKNDVAIVSAASQAIEYALANADVAKVQKVKVTIHRKALE